MGQKNFRNKRETNNIGVLNIGPFIAVKGQGISELIPEEDRDKWLIEKEDYEALANKIENFMRERYNQKLTTNIDINFLIEEFLTYLDSINK